MNNNDLISGPLERKLKCGLTSSFHPHSFNLDVFCVFPAIIGAPYRTYRWKLKRNTLKNSVANAAANTEHARQKQLKLIESFYTFFFSHPAPQFCGTRKMLVYHTILFLLCSWGLFLQRHLYRPVFNARRAFKYCLATAVTLLVHSCLVCICKPQTNVTTHDALTHNMHKG